MSVENNQDETAGFVTTSSDMPEFQTEPQEEQQQEGQANSEAPATEGEEKPAPKSEGEESEGKAQDDSGNDSDTAAPDEGKKPNRVQKRIDKVVREREDERRKNEALEKRIAELEGKGSDKSEKEPVEDDFETYDQYLDALDAYDNKPTKDQDKPEPKQEEQEAAPSLTDSQKTAMAVIKETVESATKPDDFEAVALNPEVPITGDMLEALAECEDPAKVMYHLGQNKDLATDIASGSPAQQMRAIAKLDLTVTSKPPKPTKTTNAPDPISPVGGSDAQEKAPAEMSFAEYEAHMNKKERSRQSW